MTWNYWRMVYA